ncbi:MAG TPA: ABC transporter permease [Pusillimonas sp.]|jgi:NitT/TauT family transport system permease protein|nr:ABC transporter permease [Pusillimonas sp.]MBC43058.1 ABC transporter permease [Pusillimonas sp.]HBT33927.1 ABC transporter permease [Pusillimonas sp.]HCN70280.1 ABC transporter permease [Pusillimonas sp.]HCP79090.1 ABC transporter permease [Pusillimonas sp.]|tara:strand:- start:243662 stop:244447 length:786 start_codon:yes stop_codon:yes gene_type:complete
MQKALSLSAPGKRTLLSLCGLLVLIGLWSLGTRWLQQDISLASLLGPEETFQNLFSLLADNQLTLHTLTSLKRVLVGLFLALLIGIPVGLAIGSSRTLENSTSSAFQFLRMISPLSWMPIAVMIFGIGDAPIYFLLTFAAVWPIILSTAAGVKQLDKKWLMLAKSLSATRWELLSRIIIPGILGHILTGARLAIGIIWIVLVPCEMLGVSSGLGYFILDTRDRLAYSELMAVIVLIGALGFMLDTIAQKLYQHWTHTPQQT